MFLLLISHRLKPGGRGAIVLPDGFLFGEGVKNRIKEKFLEECNLHTLVRLPNGVFNPYTGIKTNILFFTKGEPTKEIWYYEHPYPTGYKSYSKTKPIRIEEFEAEKAWWNDRQENTYAWRVDFQRLRDDAKARATPHWQAAEEAEKQADALAQERKQREAQIEELRKSLQDSLLRPKDPAKAHVQIDSQQKRCDKLRVEEQQLLNTAKTERAAGDATYWAVYNLDIKNPHAVDADHGEPEELLAAYRQLLSDIVTTRYALKHELMTALEKHKQVAPDIFFGNFAFLTDAPNGIQKLRELILQLAVQGKLVPQDPEDEPASVLFEKIQNAKEKLIKLKAVKRPEPGNPIRLEDEPYKLPTEWQWVRLTEAFDVRDGTHDTPKYIPDGFPLITSKNLSNGSLDFSNVKYISEEDHRGNLKLCGNESRVAYPLG